MNDLYILEDFKWYEEVTKEMDRDGASPLVSVEELRFSVIDWIKAMSVCHDCEKKIGEFHIDGCDEVRCKYCGCQALSCNCEQEDKFRQKVGTVNDDLISQDFRDVTTIQWIKDFFSITEKELK